ncbi:MAG: hypothetical protein ACRC41_04755 [Sarcina sp.]
MLDNKMKIINFKKTLMFMMIWCFLLTLSPPSIITIIMNLAALIFFKDIIEIYNTNKNNLFENFSLKILIKSIFEIAIVMATLIYFISLIITSPAYIVSASMLLLNSFLILLTKILKLTYKADDVKSQYFAAINKINDINQDITIFWRFKIWLTPRFDIKSLRKNNNAIYRFSENVIFQIIFFLILFGTFNRNFAILAGIVIFIAIFILIILDKIFKTYIKFEGFCIDAQEVHRPRSHKIDGYKYRIVDFNNQREMVLFLKNEEFVRYRTGDSVVIVHTAIGKKIMDHYSISKY